MRPAALLPLRGLAAHLRSKGVASPWPALALEQAECQRAARACSLYSTQAKPAAEQAPSASKRDSPAGDDGPGGQGASESTSSSSGAAGAASGEASGQDPFAGLKQGFERLRQGIASAGGAGKAAASDVPLGERASQLWSAAVHDLGAAVLPQEQRVSLTRAYDGPVYEGGGEGAEPGQTALAAVRQQKTRWQQAADDLRQRFGNHSIFSRLASFKLHDNSVARRAGELAGDLRDRYETSDHPMVHKVEDLRERYLSMSDSAKAMHEIRARDPKFDMARLLASVKADAPVIVRAFLTHDLPVLRQHCGLELIERFSGIFAHFQAQGLVEDPTILFVGEVELVELRMADTDPLVVAQFNCQQIKCTRDKFGNVIDGSPDSIQKVFYFWGLQQEAQGVVLPDGRVLPPRWVLKDMMWQSQLALV